MIAIIDYGVGNVGSIANMLQKCGADSRICSSHDEIENADKLILPGVGSFDHGMRKLRELDLVSLLNFKVKQQNTPILGICLGMQLFGERSEEGIERGLGWLDSESVKFRFDPLPGALKIPHMGWNYLEPGYGSNGSYGFDASSRFYFVHSYHVVCRDPRDVLATTSYGYTFVSAVKNENIVGVQFHPEKSHRYGLNLLRHFAEL